MKVVILMILEQPIREDGVVHFSSPMGKASTLSIPLGVWDHLGRPFRMSVVVGSDERDDPSIAETMLADTFIKQHETAERLRSELSYSDQLAKYVLAAFRGFALIGLGWLCFLGLKAYFG